MLLRAAILCCLVTATLAADGHKAKKKDARDKRNLEYSIAHHYPAQNYRLERRISTAPQLTRYPPFFPPGPRPNTQRKGRPQSLPPPPYAVQMEPLVQYSQRDPLYDSKLLGLPTVSQNDLPKGEDLLTDNTHVYPHATPKHVIERPVYIKEPEPIIEIIIKESNETLPTVPTPITPPPKKKDDVQVFYVKYRKNPGANGKDSIIYEKPIPAISPEVKHIDEEPRANYKPPPEHVTHSPPPTTTLRAIIKPDSGIYHAPKGIRITFGPHTFHDDVNEESAPQPAVSLPHSEFENRPPNFPHRIPQPYRPFNQPPPPPPPTTAQIKEQYPQFGVKLPPQLQQLPQTRNPQFLINRPPQFRQIPGPPPPPPHKRQPVPYTPFGQIRPETPVHFPGPHTHFPVKQEPTYQAAGFNELRQQFSQQQLPSVQHQQPFNPDLLQSQRPSFPQIPPQYINHLQSQQDAVLREQQLNHQQFNGNLPPSQQRPKTTHHPPQQQQNQFNGDALQGQQFLPPGGQVISSVPKYEQHITVGGEQALPLQNPQNQQKFRQDEEIKADQQQQQYYQQQLALRNQQQLALQNQQQEAQKQQLQLQQQEAQKQQFQLQQQEAQKQQYQIQQQEAQKQQYQIQQQEAQKQQFQLQQQEAQKQQFQIQQQQLQELQQQNRNAPDPFYVGTTHPPPLLPQTAPTTTQRPPVTTERKPETTTKDPSELSKQLPDEVPDDLREQLLSSGILNHAQISVLDYDKVGDIPLSALPPDQLANFYNAGGGQQIAAGSAPVPSIVETPNVDDMVGEGSEVDEVKVPKGDEVEMKVVRYDPETEDGKKIQESYVQDDATKVDPVVLNDNTYNRYLPLKVNGAEFPLPEIAELKGKKIDSVVVLAPVDYDFKEGGRVTREAREKGEKIKFASGSVLQELIEKPSKENYLRFLEHENRTSADKQAVILLVTGNVDTPKEEREIFMYDVATKTVSKLSGELSSAFVEAAEANSSSSEDTSASSSNLVEIRVPSPTEDRPVDDPEDADLEDSASDIVESRIPIIDPMEADLEPQASEQLEGFVDISGEDLTASDTKNSIESEARFDLN